MSEAKIIVPEMDEDAPLTPASDQPSEQPAAAALREADGAAQPTNPFRESDGAADESQSEKDEPFDAPIRADQAEDADGALADQIDALVINIEGYEGPLDILLELARTQKVDLRRISMVALVDQYLLFVDAAKEKNLELAADYLVMASWLAFLKSKLLLPVVAADEDEPTADEMAARLAFQLQRLEAMRKAADGLMAMPREGVHFFGRGRPEGVTTTKTPLWQADMYDLLRAYAVQRVAAVDREYAPEQPKVYSVEEARVRLTRILGSIPEWTELAVLAVQVEADVPRTSLVASAFNAALEFAKDGRIDLRQTGSFEPIYIRQRTDESRSAHEERT